MASSQAILRGDHDDNKATILSLFAVQQAALRDKQAQMLRIMQQLEELEEEKEHSERERNFLAVMVARLMWRERCVWTYARPESWFETTLPHLPVSAFRENFRLDVSTFRYIVCVCGSMARLDTNMRKAISLTKRVAIGLYRLATSAEERTVANLFVVSRSSVNIIFREFCNVVVRRLEPRFVRFPRAQELVEHLRQFAAVAGFPQGVGALDGCHIEVCPPQDHATDYYKYKGWYSTILLAVVDHHYKFMYTNVGSPGRMHDAAVFERSQLSKRLESDVFKMGVKQMHGVAVGPVLLADQAFPLQPHLMKPYARAGSDGSSTRAFNYRLSSARRVVENAFGRLKARFRILHKGLECDIDNVNAVIRASCVLHNICEEFSDQCDASWLEIARIEDASRIQPVCISTQQDALGVHVRDALAQHFITCAQN
ncbi:uncharacterized protein LOC119405714 [Rhipicephalus sanguineus]|uniref:uncharacterized protein LOC119405714 n=1 Tax=Rhipicephalus sanguineus TaxID=34632 RepID=UPI0018933E19|nr:uncharacterized protein LOC119405714 [Rhipicephalus sanguineus]